MAKTKLCKYCEPPVEKPLDDFYVRTASPDGRSNKCKNCEKKAHQQYYKKKKSKKIHRASKLRVNYGLTEAQYEKMFEEQEGACAICEDAYSKLVVDHDHKTGKVRGLLCPACNHGLGRFRDSIPIMRSALEYLEDHFEPDDRPLSDTEVVGGETEDSRGRLRVDGAGDGSSG